MKRSEALIDLSREHHSALSLALRARRAATIGGAAAVATVAATVCERFENELKPHFEEEERWVLPALSRAGETALVERTLAEHAELEVLVDRLSSTDGEALLAFADALSSHIRFEERELFQMAERHHELLASEKATRRS